MKISIQCGVVLSCIIMVTAWCAGGIVFQESKGLFTLNVPEGFEPAPEETCPSGFTCTYYLATKGESEVPIVLGVERLSSTIGREPLTNEDLAAQKAYPQIEQITLSRAHWQGFEIDVMRSVLKTPKGRMVSYTAQIPTRPQAIQVIVIGPETDEKQIRAYLDEALKGLEGESNWIPWTKSGNDVDSKSYVVILIIAGAVIVLGGIIGLWLLSRVTPKGVVLAVAVLVWLVGNAVAQERTRAMLGIGGAMKLLGFIGAIMGIVDLLRKRR